MLSQLIDNLWYIKAIAEHTGVVETWNVMGFESLEKCLDFFNGTDPTWLHDKSWLTQYLHDDVTWICAQNGVKS
jgi:hypothetical protein